MMSVPQTPHFEDLKIVLDSLRDHRLQDFRVFRRQTRLQRLVQDVARKCSRPRRSVGIGVDVARVAGMDGIVEEGLVEPAAHLEEAIIRRPAEFFGYRAITVVGQWVEARGADARRGLVLLHCVGEVGAPGGDLSVKFERDADQWLDVRPGCKVLAEEGVDDAVADPAEGDLGQVVVPR